MLRDGEAVTQTAPGVPAVIPSTPGGTSRRPRLIAGGAAVALAAVVVAFIWVISRRDKPAASSLGAGGGRHRAGIRSVRRSASPRGRLCRRAPRRTVCAVGSRRGVACRGRDAGGRVHARQRRAEPRRFSSRRANRGGDGGIRPAQGGTAESASPDELLWDHTVSGPIADIFDLQRQLSAALISALRHRGLVSNTLRPGPAREPGEDDDERGGVCRVPDKAARSSPGKTTPREPGARGPALRAGDRPGSGVRAGARRTGARLARTCITSNEGERLDRSRPARAARGAAACPGLADNPVLPCCALCRHRSGGHRAPGARTRGRAGPGERRRPPGARTSDPGRRQAERGAGTPGDGSPASSGILGQPPGARTGIFRHRAPSGSDRRVPAPHRAAARFGVGLPDARHGLPCVGRSRARARELPEGDRDRTERPVVLEHRHAAVRGRPVRRGRRRTTTRRSPCGPPTR